MVGGQVGKTLAGKDGGVLQRHEHQHRQQPPPQDAPHLPQQPQRGDAAGVRPAGMAGCVFRLCAGISSGLCHWRKRSSRKTQVCIKSTVPSDRCHSSTRWEHDTPYSHKCAAGHQDQGALFSGSINLSVCHGRRSFPEVCLPSQE